MIRLAHGERDNINIITLARGEIMRRMVKLRGAQLNQRLPALVKSPCAARWWEGLGDSKTASVLAETVLIIDFS